LPYSIYRFEAFELRPYERVLYRDQQPTSLGARAVDVLSVLVAAQGRLVSKAELLERVWPGLVVEENNLQVQISALRKQLGAQAIATVPGRGYRFCQPVEAELDHPEIPPAPGASPVNVVHAAEPAHRTMPQRPGILPAPGSPLLGRDDDLAAAQADGMQPLLTVAGQAGIGKTAFALTLAQLWKDQPADGAAWVDLASVSDPDLVVSVVAQALGLTALGADPLRSLAQAMAPLALLLVIDNAEHLLEAVARLAHAVLQGAPRVCMLVTSQLPLRVDGERVHRLGPLALPSPTDTPQQALNQGAVALFVKQVHALHRPFELDDEALACIVRLCHRLDGVPLAIKLAAARVPVLGLQGVEERLGERFKLLQGRAGVGSSRQHTLLAALDWSYELLLPAERAVFRRLAVPAGSFSIDLARQLTRDIDADEWAVIDTLADLVDRSLVVAESGEWPRYRLLDSMRDYAALKLAEADELPRTRQRHAQAMAELMERASDAHWREADAPWMALYGPDLDNVRTALDWACKNEPLLALRLVGAAAPLFTLLGLAPEGRQRALALQAVAEQAQPTPMLARYWLELSRLHWGVSAQPMHDMALRALALFTADGDAPGRYMALCCLAGSGVLPVAQAWQNLKDMAALEQPTWPARLSTQRHLAEISVLQSSERMADARRVCQSLIVRAQSAGLTAMASAAMADLAAASLAMGDLDTALNTGRALLAQARSGRDNHILHAQAVVACVCIVRNDLAGARAAMRDFMTTSASRGWEWLTLYSPLFALLAALEGRLDAAARLLGHAQADGEPGVHNVLTVYAISRVSALVQDGLEPAVMAQLLAMGQGMAPETVAAWALDQPPHAASAA
jgi:predicted ATPase/DNA-binding winged helix-turn-helix (wHTH) protein